MQRLNLNKYKELAATAVQQVFVREFHNSLGIPMPIIKILLPDEKSYSTGEYYITINEAWQIHLNFGKLPVSYLEFEEEVKVLTRHEIGHYMCCPYNVITHLRMIAKIRDTYLRFYISMDYQAFSRWFQGIVEDKTRYLSPSKSNCIL